MRTPEKAPVTKGVQPTERLSSRVYLLWAISISTISIVFAMQSLYPTLIGPISNVLPSACVGVAFVSALQCVRRYGISGGKRFQGAFVNFSMGTGLWLVAEMTWATYYFVLKVAVPYPSLADVFYMGGYVPMLIGLSLYLNVFSPGLTRRRLGVALGLIAASTIGVVLVVLPGELASGKSTIAMLTDVSYPFLDLALLSITILSLAIFYRAALSRWLLIFASGAGFYIVGDELFLYQVRTGTYYNGDIDDLLFLIAYLLIALAFYEHRRRF